MEKNQIGQRALQVVEALKSMGLDKKGQMTGTLQTVAAAAVFVLIIIMVMAFGAGFIADEKDRIEDRYGENSTAASIVETGEQSLVRLSDGTNTIVGAIVLGLVVLVLFGVVAWGSWNNQRR